MNEIMVSKNVKIEVLDSLRAFAALSVCLFHFVCTVTGFIQSEIILTIFSNGQYGVQLFFVISGFVIPWAMYHAKYEFKNFFPFFLKRLSRLEPPYLFSILLALLILYVRETYLGKSNDHIHVSAKQVVLHLGYMIPFFKNYQWLNQVYWTLAIEFQYYVLIAFLFIPFTHSSIFIRCGLYVTLILLSFFGGANFLLFWLPVFLLGIILFLFKSTIISKPEYYSVTLILITVAIFKYPLASVIYSLIPIAFILNKDDLKIAGLHVLGKFSYSIYLIHPLLGASLINVLSHRSTDPWSKFLVICAGILFTLISSWLMYILIERPSKRLSASITYKS